MDGQDATNIAFRAYQNHQYQRTQLEMPQWLSTTFGTQARSYRVKAANTRTRHRSMQLFVSEFLLTPTSIADAQKARSKSISPLILLT